MDLNQFEGRKREHIRQALDPVNQAAGMSGLASIRLSHEALPEMNFEDVRLQSACLGQTLATPFYVSGMTAGHSDAATINFTLASACARRGWAMGVGSQRRELEGDGAAARALDGWKRLREANPNVVLFANVGITQLADVRVSALQGLVDGLSARALVVHANALQEALQPEGTPRFRGAFEALKYVCTELDAPVILKETGCGFSRATLSRLAGVGLAAVDVAGLGGTHWGRIEGARAEAGTLQRLAAETFAGWGESTVDSVLAARECFTGTTTGLWASGGVRSGLDAAKLIALGAQRVGYAKPALEAALRGDEVLDRWMELQEFELKTALFCTGSATPTALREKRAAWKINET